MDDERVRGAHTRSLMIYPVWVQDVGWYDCVVDNEVGTATSAAARLSSVMTNVIAEPAPE